MKSKILISSMKTYYFLFTFFFCVITIFAQDCKNVENYCHHPREKTFSKSGMSHSSIIKSKQIKIFNVSMFEGKEYFISVCGKSVVGSLHLRIFSIDNKLMYDNASEGLSDNISIKSDITQTLIFEVNAPLGILAKEKKACLGVYIASRKWDPKK